MRLTAAGWFFFVLAPIILVTATLGCSLLAAATSPCIESGPVGWPIELTGWHDDVKCYHGKVIDYR